MATSKIQAPQAIAFNTDPEQQIYARGVLDRDMSGLSYMFKNAADTRHQGNQDRYMQGVSEANKIAAALAQQELMSDEAMKTLAQAVKLAEMGVPGSAMPVIGRAIADNSGVHDEAMDLRRMLERAKIAAANASASGGGAGGEGGKDQVEVVLDATGTPQIKYTAKGSGGSGRAEQWTKRAQTQRQNGVYSPLGQKPPPAGPPAPGTNPLFDTMRLRINNGAP